MTAPDAVRPDKSTFRRLLTQGIFYTAAYRLTNVTTVFTYIAAELGASGLIVGLLIPAYTLGELVGTASAPRLLLFAPFTRSVLARIAFTHAVLTAAAAAALMALPAAAAGAALLVCSPFVGVVSGGSIVLVPVAVTAVLSPARRHDLMLRQMGYGAGLFVLITAASAGVLWGGSAHMDDAGLLWIGAAGMGVAAAVCLTLSSHGKALTSERVPIREVVRQGLRYGRSHRWLVRYVATQLVCLPVMLGLPFYSIYAAHSLGSVNSDLDIVLLFVGVGLVLGIPVWTAVRRRFGIRGAFVGTAALGTTAAALSLILEPLRVLPPLWTVGLVIVLVASATQAIYPASQDWVFGRAADDARVIVMSFSQIVINVGQIFAGFVIGVIARNGPALWPVAVMFTLSALALGVAIRATPQPRDQLRPVD
jgi:MFS family permease